MCQFCFITVPFAIGIVLRRDWGDVEGVPIGLEVLNCLVG